MWAEMTEHARAQLAARPACGTEREVLGAVDRRCFEISRSNRPEVLVQVKILGTQVAYPDGSNGDVVLAAVDPRTLKVKTIMLQRSTQVNWKQHTGKVKYM